MITDSMWADLLDVRAIDPGRFAELATGRRRRPLLGADGRLFLLAADHPARGSLGVRADPLALADRRDLLERLLTGLADPRVDGLLASPDIIEELLVLDGLHDRVVIGTMNRAGLVGSVWELDDRFTAYDAGSIDSANLDGGKMLLRVDDNDPGTLPTLVGCAGAVAGLAARGLMAMIEPLPYKRDSDGRAQLLDDDNALIRASAIAASLGPTSAHTWLKLPATDDVERVMAATSQPALILGGAPGSDPAAAYAAWERALAVANVRGLVVGRSLLYPPDGDVAAAVNIAAQVVHPK